MKRGERGGRRTRREDQREGGEREDDERRAKREGGEKGDTNILLNVCRWMGEKYDGVRYCWNADNRIG